MGFFFSSASGWQIGCVGVSRSTAAQLLAEEAPLVCGCCSVPAGLELAAVGKETEGVKAAGSLVMAAPLFWPLLLEAEWRGTVRGSEKQRKRRAVAAVLIAAGEPNGGDREVGRRSEVGCSFRNGEKIESEAAGGKGGENRLWWLEKVKNLGEQHQSMGFFFSSASGWQIGCVGVSRSTAAQLLAEEAPLVCGCCSVPAGLELAAVGKETEGVKAAGSLVMAAPLFWPLLLEAEWRGTVRGSEKQRKRRAVAAVLIAAGEPNGGDREVGRRSEVGCSFRDAGLLGEWLKEEGTESGRPVHEL
ncbi:non-specific lipid-transfer protein 13-like [Populus alba x Populus x berolinensis]|uniref:Non-specific lipid-transfer protein 13-like n=1 Tax=Populus alba x Populus x berolinensis TaxID=444605 RepID=A0AAD6R2Z3_9ROSI|nr:non-specific lipid-transfer protein 13-like [Populus alba x Populus x berolinensis]